MIRKITPDGEVTTLAGSGTGGSSDGKGSEASFRQPNGLTVDQDGNVYVADTYNYKIRKITSDGVVTTVAGSGLRGSSDGTAAEASFYYPNNLCVDAFNYIYVSDTKNNLIRKISPDGNVTTFAGNETQLSVDGYGTEASFDAPNAIIFDKNGDLVVSDTYGNLIRKIYIENKVTAVTNKAAASEISIYPMPALNYFTLSFNVPASTHVKMELLNVTGSIAQTNEANYTTGNQEMTILTDQLVSGMYITKLYLNGSVMSSKVVIEK